MYHDTAKKVRELTDMLNRYRDEYYNSDVSSVSDAEYDRLFDELAVLERATGCVLSNSPTQTVGYPVVSGLEKAQHPIPLLSLEKTKSIEEVVKFIGSRPFMLMHKLDGLTVKLEYEDGKLLRGSTRGDGNEGEVITHNVRAFRDVPVEIPYKGRLTVTGEAFILKSDFERLRETLLDSTGEPYKNSRNLASGSVRALDSSVCAQRCISFTPFSVLEGLDENPAAVNSKFVKLNMLTQLGFSRCEAFLVTGIFTPATRDEIQSWINELREKAVQDGIPIDGIVVTYNDIEYSRSCGRTGHHYKDGVAFKFEDDVYESRLREIEWNTTRSGLISPVAVFDAVEIDGCSVSRATLSNVSIIKKLKLIPGCRILVSKRNQVIPHVEEVLDPSDGEIELPKPCPCCGKPTVLQTGREKKGEEPTETLHCVNEDCPARHLASFCHFVSKKALNIVGLAEATLEKFIGLGWIKEFPDIFHLDKYRNQIVVMDGFGKKSYDRLWNAIEESRNTTFEQFVISCDIPMVGRHASTILAEHFGGDLDAFEQAARSGFSFSNLDGFGMTLQEVILSWFGSASNLALWSNLRKEVTIMQNSNQVNTAGAGNPFSGKTVVVTGTLAGYTRGDIESKLYSLGAKPGSSVSAKTDYVLAGEKAGSKLTKANALGIKVLTEDEFHNMIGA